MKQLNIGFISTRIAGTDGVSLETAKWAAILEEGGHNVFYMAGELDTPAEHSHLVKPCHFQHTTVADINEACFGHSRRTPEATLLIESLKHTLKKEIRKFISQFRLDLIIPENALAIPLNLPLGLALTEVAAESDFPMIAHHHDFYWERKRFMRNGCWDYINKAFPPNLPTTQHVVLNSEQNHQLGLRTGISGVVIPNVMDFANPPALNNEARNAIRRELGFTRGEKLILQPTRIIRRKGIEHAIELVKRLDLPAKLVIPHKFGDEGDDYAHRVIEYSKLMGVQTILCQQLMEPNEKDRNGGGPRFTLSDLYQSADFVTYPSLIEGFGNALLEAMYYKRPIMVNNYMIYHLDIKPLGFKLVEINDYVSAEAVDETRLILEDGDLAALMAEENYALASRHFSYDIVRRKLLPLLINQFDP